MALAISCLSEILDCLPSNLFVVTTTFNEIISTDVRPLGESVLVQTLFSALYTKLTDVAEKDSANRPGETTALSKASICTILAEAICSIDEDNKHTEAIQNLNARGHTYTTAESVSDISRSDSIETSGEGSSNANQSTNLEFIVDSGDDIPDVLCGELFKTFVGKQCTKVSLL